MSIASKPLPGTVWDPLYPETDGEPMGETDYHMLALILLRWTLEDYYASSPRVYVASDMFWYYVKGDPRAVKAPDVMVVKGVGKHKRQTFRSWEENAIPRVIFEILSGKTWQEDVGPKKLEYERLGVVEYFLFDVEACFIDPPLQGFRLEIGRYAPILPDQDGSLFSQELGLRVIAEGQMVRLLDAETGEKILTLEEKKEMAEIRAEQERERAEQERKRAEQEKQRADALQAELTRLRVAQSETEKT
jgi:Uma2 family endonuclease